MALYICPKCLWKEKDHKYPRAMAGVITLRFKNGHVWTFPRLILHYIHDHNWLPPKDFVDDVMHGELLLYSSTDLTIGVSREIGFFCEDDLVIGELSDQFINRLKLLIDEEDQSSEVLRYYGPGEK